LPGSNASIEQVFSLMTSTCTYVRNPMDVPTVEGCLITKTYRLSFMEFHDDIIKNQLFLKKVHDTQKYTMTAKDEA